ncbi:MAG TPA: hypothetical protein VNF51_00680 [Candidatus Paceibacterota bacterium]|nr:hypothetical protein [Candidatus Paceibacterota bacterium]
MKSVFKHVEHLKRKPHHIRKRVAFATAAGIAGFVALVWFAGSLGSGTFAIQGSTFAESTGQQPVITTNAADGTSGLAGAAAALSGGNGNVSAAHIEIVDVASATPAKPAEQTIIPF